MSVQISPGNDGLRRLESWVAAIPDQSGSQTTPIVLVSGFSGWGEALFGTINYWGGFEDLPLALSHAGYTVIVVRIGPFSSNMERACEIYGQLRNIRLNGGFDKSGGNSTQIPVNYGTAHPSQHPDLQDAWTWQAVVYGNLPNNWEWNARNKVNFICHSQGGITLRYLVELMSGRHTATHPNFLATDCQDWIKSLSTMGTPHKGTTVTDVVRRLLPPDYLDLITRLVVSMSFKPPGSRLYDLQLDHWGFSRLPNETFQSMEDRLKIPVKNWWESNHNGFYDNSIDGVRKLDTFAGAPSLKIYYFTMSFCATDPFPNRTLSPADINSLTTLFPFNQIWNPLGVWGNVLGPTLSIGSQFPGSPQLRDFAGWFTGVANNHLREMNYFSQIPAPGTQIPRRDVLPFLMLFAYAMGGYSTELYHRNDGIVNTQSMDGPRLSMIQQGGPEVLSPARGMHWHLGTNVTMDHADEIGVFTDPNTVCCMLRRPTAGLGNPR